MKEAQNLTLHEPQDNFKNKLQEYWLIENAKKGPYNLSWPHIRTTSS